MQCSAVVDEGVCAREWEDEEEEEEGRESKVSVRRKHSKHVVSGSGPCQAPVSERTFDWLRHARGAAEALARRPG